MESKKSKSKKSLVIIITTVFFLFVFIDTGILYCKSSNSIDEKDKTLLKTNSLLSSSWLVNKGLGQKKTEGTFCEDKNPNSDKTSITLNIRSIGIEIPAKKAEQDELKIDVVKKKLKASKNLRADCEKIITEHIVENEKLQSEKVKLQLEKDELSKSINMLSQEIEDLKEKLEVAKALKVNNVEIICYKGTKKDSKPSVKSKEINCISGIFEIPENPLAEAGNKEVYLIIYDTKGNVMTLSTSKFINKSNRKKQMFSATKTVEYKNLKTKVIINFDCSQKLIKGKYKVEICIDGIYSEKKEFIIE